MLLLLFEPYYVEITDTVQVVSFTSKSKGKYLTQFMNRNGYPRVWLYKDGTKKMYLLHRLVAEAVYGPCPEGMEVNHKDHNRANPMPENLEYVTRSENAQHMIKAGRANKAVGPSHWNFKDGRCKDINAYARSRSKNMTSEQRAKKYARNMAYYYRKKAGEV